MQAANLRIANDLARAAGYPRQVSKTRPKRYTNWYLREWMDTLEVSQTDLIEATDLSKATISLLCNDQQDYNPSYIRDMAIALKISPYELLMHPDDAMALRRLISDAGRVSDIGRRLQAVPDRKDGTNG